MPKGTEPRLKFNANLLPVTDHNTAANEISPTGLITAPIRAKVKH